MKFQNGSLVHINPCEVELSNGKYPALGLEVLSKQDNSTDLPQHDGRIIKATSLDQAAEILPFAIFSLAESDPLEEGTTTEYTFISEKDDRLVIRHIMPPMTLGIIIEKNT